MTPYRRATNEWLASIEIDVDAVVDIGGGRRTVQGRLGECRCRVFHVLDRAQYRGKPLTPDIEHDMNRGGLQTAQRYDAAFMVMMFEFLWDPVQAFTTAYDLLRPGGRFYWNAALNYPGPRNQRVVLAEDGTERLVAGEDYYRITKPGVYRLSEETGFRVDRVSDHEDFFMVEATRSG